MVCQARAKVARGFAFSIALLATICSCGATDHEPYPASRQPMLSQATGLVAWHPSGKYLATTDPWARLVCLWNVSSRSRVWCVPKVGLTFERSLAFSKSGDRVITRSTRAWGPEYTDETVSLLDTRTGAVAERLRDVPPASSLNAAHAFSVSRTGRLAVVMGEKTGTIAIYRPDPWTLANHVGPLTSSFGKQWGLDFVAMDEGRRRVSVGLVDGEIQVWSLDRNSLIKRFSASKVGLRSMLIDETTGLLFTGGSGVIDSYPISLADGRAGTRVVQDDPAQLLRSWNPATGEPVRVYYGPGVGVAAMSLAAQGCLLAAVEGGQGNGAHVAVWNRHTGAPLWAFDYGHRSVNSVAFDPQGRRLAVGTGSGLDIFDVTSEADRC